MTIEPVGHGQDLNENMEKINDQFTNIALKMQSMEDKIDINSKSGNSKLDECNMNISTILNQLTVLLNKNNTEKEKPLDQSINISH